MTSSIKSCVHEISATTLRANNLHQIAYQTSWRWSAHINSCNGSQTMPSTFSSSATAWAEAAWSWVQHATIEPKIQLHVFIECAANLFIWSEYSFWNIVSFYTTFSEAPTVKRINIKILGVKGLIWMLES